MCVCVWAMCHDCWDWTQVSGRAVYVLFTERAISPALSLKKREKKVILACQRLRSKRIAEVEASLCLYGEILFQKIKEKQKYNIAQFYSTVFARLYLSSDLDPEECDLQSSCEELASLCANQISSGPTQIPAGFQVALCYLNSTDFFTCPLRECFSHTQPYP